MISDATTRFSNRVDHYVKYRPTYPQGLLEFLHHAIGFTPDWTIADIGSGTGISTQMLLDHGNTVYAVEPNREMRSAAERMLVDSARFHSVAATATATTLGDSSIDLITVMQAFHWFEPAATRLEFARILKPAGWVALVWNDRRLTGDPFVEAYEQLLVSHGTDYSAVRQSHPADSVFEAFFAPGRYQTHVIPNDQLLDKEGLAGRVMSSSYAPAEGQQGHAAMMEDVERLFNRFQENGHVRIVYDTRAYFGQLV